MRAPPAVDSGDSPRHFRTTIGRLLVAVAVRIIEQRALDAFGTNAVGVAQDLRSLEIVGIDDRTLDSGAPAYGSRERIRLARREDDGSFVRRHRPGVSVESGNRVAHQLVEDAAAAETSSDQMR